jgi:hypothetical protein
MSQYKLVRVTALELEAGIESKTICKVGNPNLYIPMDENNTDYQIYLKWVAAGNTPEPADE